MIAVKKGHGLLQHKEGTKARRIRDESDVQSLTQMLGDTMSNPFKVSNDNQGHLTNIATGMVLPDDIADKLVNARQEGETLLQEYIEKRIIDKETERHHTNISLRHLMNYQNL